MPDQLPIDPLLPQITATLRSRHTLVITAPPGAGKTTRVPRALLDTGFADAGEILILEPRRLAARLAAARVAEEFGQKPGETVGYSVRFENVESRRTRVRFITEGIFSRRIVQDPALTGVSTVILDEFHERHVTTDIALALLRRLRAARPSLNIVVMSATLETGTVSAFLDEATVIEATGRNHPVTIEYEQPKGSDRPLEHRVAEAVARLVRENLPGDILVFLPGAFEIRRCSERLLSMSEHLHLSIVPLHGELPAAEQARALVPSEKRKVILATNVAETSVTIPGIGAVVDSGLARFASYSAWSGLPRLALAKISKASAEQRAGRAGRTQAGRVLRLYPRHDYEGRPDRDVPEIKRADLAETVLTLRASGVADLRSFSWFESPPQPALDAAEGLLIRLGALDAAGRITETGRLMLRLPVHPRLARLIDEGVRRGAGSAAALAAALVSERDIRADIRSGVHTARRPRAAPVAGASDLIELAALFEEAESSDFDRVRMRAIGLDPGAVEKVASARRQLQRLLPTQPSRAPRPDSEDESLLIAALAAFPDRVARRSARGSDKLLLAGGGSARLSEFSVVHTPDLMVAVDVEERTGGRGSADTQSVVVRLASAIQPEWLAELAPDQLSSEVRLQWNDKAERVDQVSRTNYGQLVLDATVRPAQTGDETSDLLASKLLEKGISLFDDGDKVPELLTRVQLMREHFPDEQYPPLDAANVRTAVRELCADRRSFAELARASVIRALVGILTDRQRRLLAREAPDRVLLRNGQTVRVHYEATQPPWIESRLQDFFGMTQGPAICSGKVRLTMRLLAPNGRPVQVTQDLAGFWQRHYPAIKRELQRRYPKHPWP
jgi:ATP-dependent helicase HrpB